MLVPWMIVLAFIPAVASHAFHVARFEHAQTALVGPKAYYLALGDSLAFGYQPNLNWDDGYTRSFSRDLAPRAMRSYTDLACPGESTGTMISGGCPYALLHQSLYSGSQLQAAVNYLHQHAGQVSPVTLDIGVNDLIPDLNAAQCAVNSKWQSDLAQLESNLKNVILPRLVAAMTVNGQITGDLILLNYYDPYQDTCPNTVETIQMLNQGLATSSGGRVTVVDIFNAFAAPANALMAPSVLPATSAAATTPVPTPASTICAYTWMCGLFKDIHPNSAGYAAMARAIERTVHY